MRWGNSDEPEVIRIASWSLAYYYHYLHLQGAELGYVELVSELSEIDLFLLFNRRQEFESPYAAVIYPKGTDQYLDRATAQRWVDRIFPASVRGNLDRDSLQSGMSDWYQRGYIGYRASVQNADCDLIENVIIGYRSQSPWNPKQFL